MQDKTVLAGYVKRCAIFHATRVRSLTCCIKLVHGILASGLNDAAASDGIFAERSLALLRACVVSPDASLRRETNQIMLAIFARHPAAAANARARARPRTHTGAAEGGRTKHRSTARAELFLLALHAVLNDALDARCAAHSREEGAGLGAAPGSAAHAPCFSYPTHAVATEHVLRVLESISLARPGFFVPHRRAVCRLTRLMARLELTHAASRASSAPAIACGVRLLTAHVERSVAEAEANEVSLFYVP